MSAPKKKSGTGGRPTATRTGNRPGGARQSIPKAAKPSPDAARPTQSGKRGKTSVPPPRGSEIVVGTIPLTARLAGLLGVAAAVLLLLRLAFPLVTAGGEGLGAARNLADYLVTLPLALAVGVGGLLAVLGKLPRFGLALVVPAGAVAVGSALRLVPQLDTAAHSTGDLPLPEGALRYLHYTVSTGLALELVADLVLVAAVALIALSWRRTVMEDAGSFDSLRPTFGALALTGAIGQALAVVFAPLSPVGGAPSSPVPSIFSRFGLDQFGSWLELLAFVVVALVGAVARPRLGAVGMFAGLSALALTQTLAMMLIAGRTSLLEVGAGPKIGLGVAVWFALMAAGAWKLTRRPRTEPSD